MQRLEARQLLNAKTWIDDALPPNAGAVSDYESYSWVTSNPPPQSGTASIKGDGGGGIYNIYNVFPPYKVGAGDTLFAWAYVDPANPPTELMLEFCSQLDRAHRGYFGDDDFYWVGTNGTDSKRRLGDIPFARNAANQPVAGWVQLSVPASAVGIEDQYINGIQLFHAGGSIAWDTIGIDALNVTAGPMTVDAAPPYQSFTFDEVPTSGPILDGLTLENLSTNTTIPRSQLSVGYNTATRTAKLKWPGVNGGTGKLSGGNYSLTLSSTYFATAAGKHLGGDTSIETWWLDADFNRDRTVNQADYDILIAHYGSTDIAFRDGDANLDGNVDTLDFGEFFAAYGRTIAAPPTIANNLKVTNQYTDSLDLYWQQGGDTPDGYRIYRSLDGTNFTQIDEVGADNYNLTYTDNINLQDGTKYWYRVRPYTDAAGNGLSYTKAWGVTQLPTPTNVAVSNVSYETATVTFTDRSANETGFLAYAMIHGVLTPVGSAAAHPGTGTVSINVSGLDPDTQYGIRVQAFSAATQSALTVPVILKTLDGVNLAKQANAFLASLTNTSPVKMLYTGPNPDDPQLNSSCWFNSTPYAGQLTGVSASKEPIGTPLEEFTPSHNAVTLISRQHVLMAEHYPAERAYFLGSDGVVYRRQIIQRIEIGPKNIVDGYQSDIAVGILESPLPSAVRSYSILPEDFTNYLSVSSPIAMVTLDREKNVSVDFLNSVFGPSTLAPAFVMGRITQIPFSYYEYKILGDSGHPWLMPVNGELVLATLASYPSQGPAIHRFRSDIDNAMSTLTSLREQQLRTKMDDPNLTLPRYSVRVADMSTYQVLT